MTYKQLKNNMIEAYSAVSPTSQAGKNYGEAIPAEVLAWFLSYNGGINRSVMYRFDIAQQKDGTWRFELDGINMILEGYIVDKDKHLIQNPEKAIAYFNVAGHVYGVSNQFKTYGTAEDFYDVMKKQYSIFDNTKLDKTGSEELQQAS